MRKRNVRMRERESVCVREGGKGNEREEERIYIRAP